MCLSVSLYVDFVEEDHAALAVLPVVILLGHSNSAVNPVLYCLMTRRLHRPRSTIRRRRTVDLSKPTTVTAGAAPDCVTLQLLGDGVGDPDSQDQVADAESLDETEET